MATNTIMRGFVPDPAERGTFGILWSCLTVLGLCAWTSLHLGLPSKEDIPGSSDIFSLLDDFLDIRFLYKITGMALMLLAPELVLASAVNECCGAYRAMRHINREGKLSAMDMWTMNDGFFLVMEGLTHNGKPVNADGIVQLIRDKQIPPQPSRAREIRDKSKADALGKFLTCAQALWLVIQCLARAIQRLPISTLELGTIGYVFIAVAINGLYWYKPKDVIIPLDVLSWEARGMSPSEEAVDAPVDASARDVSDNEIEKTLLSDGKSLAQRETWLDRLTTGDAAENLTGLSGMSVCALYGGWHCLAWSFTFPSVTEQWLWRIGSILASIPPFMLVVLYFVNMFVEKYVVGMNSVSEFVMQACNLIVAAIYITSRGFIVVEMFIGLRRLPAGVFDTIQWMAFIPHV